jgi:tRNA-intron endonuclease
MNDIEIINGKIYCFDQSLQFIGKREKNYFLLEPEEALWLAEIRNFNIFEKGKIVTIQEFFKRFKFNRIGVRYIAYRDWKNRGLHITYFDRIEKKNYNKSPIKSYPASKIEISEKFEIYFDEEELLGFVFDEKAKELFYKYWFGQYGIYKNPQRGKFLILDIFEVLFLSKQGFKVYSNTELNFDDILKIGKKKIENLEYTYQVYEDWRSKGYILKTGFKFGTHFRIYFPGASPLKKGKEWQHSKHVIHIFYKDVSLPMNEWARAVRVAHGVRKTFITAIPGMKKEDYMKENTPIDFVVYHRNEKNEVEIPNKNDPSYILMTFYEDEKLSGKILASALDLADSLGLKLLIGIVDRESSVTYYVAHRIDLPGSENKYYEIDWFNP